MARYDEVFTSVAQQFLRADSRAAGWNEERDYRLGRHRDLEHVVIEGKPGFCAGQVLVGRCAVSLDTAERGQVGEEREVNVVNGLGSLIEEYEHQRVAVGIDGG